MKTELTITSPDGSKVTEIDTRMSCTITTNNGISELVLTTVVSGLHGYLLTPETLGVNGIISEHNMVEVTSTYDTGEKITMCRLQVKLADYRRTLGIDHINEILTIIGSELI